MSLFGLPTASSLAPESDELMAGLLIISILVLVLVFGLMLLYMIRYRAGSPIDRGKLAEKSWRFEISWTTATLVVFFGLFLWGADLYLRLFEAPPNALKIYVVGKQWMWKVEHQGGQREINTLHVPINRPVQLLMTSEDVIHDFAIPAFRIRHDVLPGRYETMWFRATKVGAYHLFCDQFCGTDHSSMVGQIIVMSQPDYQKWLAANTVSGGLIAEGRAEFTRFGCGGCHKVGPEGTGGAVRAPSLVGLYGSPVPLSNGTVVIADDRYIHDCIMRQNHTLVAGYKNIMPNFSTQLSEDDVIKLLAYIKSLAPVTDTGS